MFYIFVIKHGLGLDQDTIQDQDQDLPKVVLNGLKTIYKTIAALYKSLIVLYCYVIPGLEANISDFM